tara:strand:- start:226 stop:786 length:561 start_codon:yes stop_codon:yes gene_type:complete
MGLALGALATLGSLGLDVADRIVGAVPGPMEARLRKQMKADQERLAGGGGGMSAAKRGEMEAQLAGQVRGTQGELMAQAARGSATGQMAAPQGAQVMLGASKQAQEQIRQGRSDIRAQDLALAESQRDRLNQQMTGILDLGRQRKSSFMSPIAPSAQTSQLADQILPNRGQQAAATDIAGMKTISK